MVAIFSHLGSPCGIFTSVFAGQQAPGQGWRERCRRTCLSPDFANDTDIPGSSVDCIQGLPIKSYRSRGSFVPLASSLFTVFSTLQIEYDMNNFGFPQVWPRECPVSANSRHWLWCEECSYESGESNKGLHSTGTPSSLIIQTSRSGSAARSLSESSQLSRCV